MSVKKLVRLEAGYLDGAGTEVSDSVYDRPVMLVYCGKFDSMDGPVEITDSHIERLASEHNSRLSKIKRFAVGEIPMREYPPIQLDHSPSAVHTVGRLVGDLVVGEAEIDGDKKKALFGTVRFLGRENVEKAKDGRYTHVSIGADLENYKLNELSVTPFPAAPKASLLSKKRLASHGGVEYEIVEVAPGEYDIVIGGQKVTHHAGTPEEVDKEARRYIDHEKKEIGMHDKLKKHLMEHRKLSEKEAEELAKKMSAHHMKHMGMDEEKMSKHLADADDKEMKRMADEHDEHEKKLAAESPKDEEKKKEEEKKMTAAREGFLRLAKGISGSTAEMAAELKVSAVNARLASLRGAGKITPAEIKKLDVARMASMSSEACEAALSTFEIREPVLPFNVMNGTTKAEAIQAVARKHRLARMELESRLNMPMKRKEAEVQLAKLAEEEKKELAALGADNKEPDKGMLHKMTYDSLVKMLEDGKQHDELKKHLKHLVDHYHMAEGEPQAADEKRMSALAKNHGELQNRFNELVSIVSPILGIKPDELKP